MKGLPQEQPQSLFLATSPKIWRKGDHHSLLVTLSAFFTNDCSVFTYLYACMLILLTLDQNGQLPTCH